MRIISLFKEGSQNRGKDVLKACALKALKDKGINAAIDLLDGREGQALSDKEFFELIDEMLETMAPEDPLRQEFEKAIMLYLDGDCEEYLLYLKRKEEENMLIPAA